jgi:hypothetical protein
MKDYTIVANNKNKTKITFSYDHGLPFKHSIQPEIEYGVWKKHPEKALIKVNLDEEEFNLFENKQKISCIDIYIINNDYWLDLNDVYLIIKKDDYLEQKFKEYNIMIAFLHNNKIINGLEF